MRYILTSCILFFYFMGYSQVDFFKNPIDSILKNGSVPKFDSRILEYLQENNESVTILYRVSTDTCGVISTLYDFPLFNIGNDLDTASFIWKSIDSSIRYAMRSWKLKPRLWRLSDRKLSDTLNSNMHTRPNEGKQLFFIFFTVNDDILHNPIYLDIFNERH